MTATASSRKPNRLIRETSPYLLQHAHNPVDWYPWGPEALERARRESKPILLSIGYSACHWCHVMEQESFEDDEVARAMNELFVCIKVDREERPDLDKVYQIAHQALTGRAGGWPLNMFLAPHDHIPFFGGTYFPRRARLGLPDFPDLLRHVSGAWREQREAIGAQAASLREVLRRIESPPAAGAVEADTLRRARLELGQQFDRRHGGLVGAPKFPHPTAIDLLLQTWARSVEDHDEDAEALHMAQWTLRAMARGGICDQVGGGFFRYAVDERWEIPHFEKMLYDNALLLSLYADAAVITGDAELAHAARATARWAMREMQAPDGGFYASLDADSDGREGAYYLWTPAEVRALLTDAEWRAVETTYGLDEGPNFEGRWHLNLRQDETAVARRLDLAPETVRALLDAARPKLLAARQRRERPGRDHKVLTSWNGLMIGALARAGRLLDEPTFVDAAERALYFLQREVWRDNRLQAVYAGGRAAIPAYVDDYAFTALGTLELMQLRWNESEFAFACALADAMLAHFEDRERGGFYFTADDQETLIHRHKPVTDDALPAGNGAAALLLVRLGHLTGERRYADAAARTLQALWPTVRAHPSAHGAMLRAAGEHLAPAELVVLHGMPAALRPWTEALRRDDVWLRMVVPVAPGTHGLPPTLAAQKTLGPVTAYRCRGTRCLPPVTDLGEFRRQIDAGKTAAAAVN
jgi:uncharacterized protein